MWSFGHVQSEAKWLSTHLSTAIDCRNRWKWTSAQSMPKAQPTLCSSLTLTKGVILCSSRETGSLWDFGGTDTYIQVCVCYKKKSDHIWPQFGLYSNCHFYLFFFFPNSASPRSRWSVWNWTHKKQEIHLQGWIKSCHFHLAWLYCWNILYIHLMVWHSLAKPAQFGLCSLCRDQQD